MTPLKNNTFIIPNQILKSKYELVNSNDPILINPVPLFDFNSTYEHSPLEIANILLEVLEIHNGYGLSANQIGLPYRVFILNTEPKHICFNPSITSIIDPEVEMMEEGCLSFPNLIVKIKRPKGIRLKFYDISGNIVVKKFYGLTSRIAQHELDHLNGITILDRISKLQKQRALKKWNR